MSKKYVTRWNHAQDVFKTATKPMTKWVPATPSPLKFMEAVDAVEEKAGTNQNALQAFEQAVTAFSQQKTSYLHNLDGTVAKVPQGHDRDTYAHALTVLKTELTALESTMKAQIGTAKSAIAGHTMKEGMAHNFVIMTESATHRALAFIAKAKTTPTGEYFNANIQKAARDITQQIGNIDKLKKDGFQFQHEQPTALFTTLKAWGNDGRVVHVTSPNNEKAEVLAEIGHFEQAVQGVDRWLKGEE